MVKPARTWIIIGILICAAFASGYGLSAYLQVIPGPTVAGSTIIDDLGRSVTVPTDPKRIVSMAAACTVALYDIGCENLIVGVDKFSSEYVPESSAKVDVGSPYSPSLETIVGLESDLIFNWYYGRRYISTLEENIPIIYVDPKSIDDIFQMMRMIGLVVSRQEKVEQVISGIENKIDAIENKIKYLGKENRPLVYYELKGVGKTLAQGTFTNEMIFKAGGINIAAEEPVRYPILNQEYIIERNPDVIIVVSYGADVEEIKNRPGWHEIRAVKENRVYKIESSLVSATPRMILGLEQFAKWFHPDLFG